MDVLFEQKIQEHSSGYEGLTDNYIRVIASSNVDLKGKLVLVKIIASKTGYLEGIVV